MEDTDIGLRASARARVGRTSEVFLHDEGALNFLAGCRKKAGDAHGIAAFRRKHGSQALASHLRRPYFERPSLLLARPALGLGVLALKGGEATAVAAHLLFDKASRPERASGQRGCVGGEATSERNEASRAYLESNAEWGTVSEDDGQRRTNVHVYLDAREVLDCPPAAFDADSGGEVLVEDVVVGNGLQEDQSTD